MRVLILLALIAAGCGRPAQPNPVATPAPAQAQAPVAAPAPPVPATPRRDLAADEAKGGHTLARHVGKTDEELADRLRREPGISAASTYTDRATAERVVGTALQSGGQGFDTWRRRRGRRPNFVLNFAADHPIGRSLGRGRRDAVPCEDALVVLRWDDRAESFYVLTSYPEVRR
jgi:hypothetical protein